MMWFLKAGDERVFYVRGGKLETYVGRSAEVCDLVLAGDSSVSRRHAVLNHERGRLILKDLGAKYGTYVNENIESKTPLGTNDNINLKSGDRIRFGVMENVWTAHNLPLVTCTSTVKGENLEELKKDIDVVGGTLVAEWDESCTHLTMPAITLTAKVLAALAHGSHIVTADYWKAWRNAMDKGEAAPDPSAYLPEVIENTLNTENVSFAPDERRGSIYAGKKFIFFSRKQMNFYKNIVERCGASVALLSECKLTKSKLCADNVVVVQFSGVIPGQETQSQRQIVADIVTYMAERSRRVIPDAEIGLALLMISTEKYCNPKRNFMQVLNPCINHSDKSNQQHSKVLAPETQRLSPVQVKTDKPDVIIDESLVSMNENVEGNMSQEPGSSRETVERTKRKFHDVGDSSNEFVRKKPALADTSLRSDQTVDENMFDFVEEISKTGSEASSKTPVKKLSFMKAKNRKKETVVEENFFNFLPDKKETKKSSSAENVQRPSLFHGSATKRKTQDIDLPQSKKPHIEMPPQQIYDVKVDISELLKNSFWKSCAEEIAKQEIIKTEINEFEDAKIDFGKTVVSVRDNLVVKKETLSLISNASYSGPNFKKFKKILPLRMQITVIPSSVMSMHRSETQREQADEVHSSDEDEQIWIQNTNKGRKRGVR